MFPLACRVCLGGNMKMYSIEKYTFKEMFEKIIKFDPRDGLPNTVCYICVAQLQRCRRLSDMAHKSAKALTHLLHSGIEISHSKITALKLGAVHSLAVTVLPPLTAIDYTEETSLVKIKVEQETETTEENTVKTEDGKIEIELKPTFGSSARCKQDNEISSPFICRICLGGNVKMFTFENNNLKEIFEKVTSLKIDAGELPALACYICVSQLQRCRRFSARAHESALALTRLLNNDIEISHKTISAFNLGLNPANNLTVKVLPQLTVTDNSIKGNFLVEIKPDNLIPFNKIKKEIIIETVKTETAERDDWRMMAEVEIDSQTIKQPVPISFFRDSNKHFVCKICNRKCISKIIMFKHLKFHKEKFIPLQESNEINYFRDGDKRFVCKLCNRKCVAKLTMIKHLRHHKKETFSPQESDETSYYRDSDKQFVCRICDKKCKSKKSINNHLRAHTEGTSRVQAKTQDSNEISYFHDSDKQFACKLCDKKLKTKKAIINHIKFHTGEKPLAKTQEIGEIKYFRDSDKKYYICKICQRKCISKITMTKHVKVHPDGQEPYVMEQPKMQTYEGSYFRDIDKQFVCKICNRKCNSKSTVIKHIRTHTGEKPYVCDVCDRSFKQKGGLNYHKQIHEPEKPRRKKLHLVCDTCNKVFSQVSHFKVHKLRHTGERPFCCSTCNKSFVQAAHLRQHARLHTGDKPFACNVCSEAFARGDYLKKHLLLHTEHTEVDQTCNDTEAETSKIKVQSSSKQSLLCKYCAKAFHQSKDLKEHERGHTGDRPYECDVCAKTFNHPGSLKNHKRIHSGEKPHVCHICSKSFIQSSNLRRHLLTHSNPKRRGKIKKKVIGCEGTDRKKDDQICP